MLPLDLLSSAGTAAGHRVRWAPAAHQRAAAKAVCSQAAAAAAGTAAATTEDRSGRRGCSRHEQIAVQRAAWGGIACAEGVLGSGGCPATEAAAAAAAAGSNAVAAALAKSRQLGRRLAAAGLHSGGVRPAHSQAATAAPTLCTLTAAAVAAAAAAVACRPQVAALQRL